jgi:4-amino-4-deoxy-L-arabinose transferase-like glycosyltransferase
VGNLIHPLQVSGVKTASPSARTAVAALALVFVVAHLWFLPPTLEDIDSINFALGVADFDVARHQPHPPGYPIFIALGKASTGLLRAAGVRYPEARGLAIWSVLSGAALMFLLFELFRALDGRPSPAASSSLDEAAERRALWATVITVCSPIFWFTALRPLSDMTGLAAAVAAQALIVSAIARRGASRELMLGAFVAGLAIGVRSQTFLLTAPLLGLALVMPQPGLRLKDRVAAGGAAIIGALAWAVPLIVASGGVVSYAGALGSQAGEDFSGVVMLWTTRTARVALDAALNSFLWPWAHLIAGGIVVAIAAAGCVRLAWRAPRTLGVLLVAYVPYAIFHLLFQETVTVRYALPLVIPIAYLFASALEWPGRGVLSAGAAALAAWSLFVTWPAAVTYGRSGSPTFRALREAAGGGIIDPAQPERVIALHAVARRAAEWLGAALPARVLTGPHGHEWLTLVDHWKSNPRSGVLLVADPRRTDLALFDPAARSAPLPYRWGFVEPPFVGGARPGNADVYAIRPPGWMLDRGWALTAEVGGVTASDAAGPHKKPSVAWVQARQEDALLMIGGRHLGGSGDPDIRLTLTVNGRPFHSLHAKPGFFFTVVPVPAGTLAVSGPYVPLEVKAELAGGNGPAIPAGLEQFDLQSPGVPMVGFADGWFEPEYDPRIARAWRWVSERGTLWVRPIGRDVTLTLAGESPLHDYDAAPTVTISIGGRQIARYQPSTDFTQDVVLPADALASADGRVVIESDKWFVPGEREGSGDQRHLAMRIYSWSVR